MNLLPGQPNRLSPAEASRDPAYELVTGYHSSGYYPAAEECVVRHKETDTYWRAVFLVYEDSSDYDMPANWSPVIRKTRTITYFERLPPADLPQ